MRTTNSDSQGSAHGPSLDTSQGAPNTYRLAEGALRSGVNETITLSPSPLQPTPLTEIQERLPQILPITAPDGDEQKAELRELTDKIAQESWSSSDLEGVAGDGRSRL